MKSWRSTEATAGADPGSEVREGDFSNIC